MASGKPGAVHASPLKTVWEFAGLDGVMRNDWDRTLTEQMLAVEVDSAIESLSRAENAMASDAGICATFPAAFQQMSGWRPLFSDAEDVLRRLKAKLVR